MKDSQSSKNENGNLNNMSLDTFIQNLIEYVFGDSFQYNDVASKLFNLSQYEKNTNIILWEETYKLNWNVYV